MFFGVLRSLTRVSLAGVAAAPAPFLAVLAGFVAASTPSRTVQKYVARQRQWVSYVKSEDQRRRKPVLRAGLKLNKAINDEADDGTLNGCAGCVCVKKDGDGWPS